MTGFEKRAVSCLGTIFALRMLGLFMVLPIFSLYAQHLVGATPTLIGVAMGIYGLSQGVLQLPFGMLSDVWGRKTIITVGLLLFALGSLICAFSDSIYGVILGRLLQGGGAIGSTLIAAMTDFTAVENRSKAMAFIGLSIGLSFFIAILLGPILNNFISVPGIFALTAVFGALGLVILYVGVGHPPQIEAKTEGLWVLLKTCLSSRDLIYLDIGIFIQHAILTANFVVIPFILENSLHLPVSEHWKVYLPILLLSFIAMMPLMMLAERKKIVKPVILSAILLMGGGQWGLWQFNQTPNLMLISFFLYFMSFNLLEAMLPAHISKIVPAQSKGTAMGVYSSAQFLGIFAGGSLGGWLYGNHHLGSVFYASLLLALGWAVMTLASNMESVRESGLINHN